MASIHRPSRARQAYERRPCECGCGHTFVLSMKNRSRKFAEDCPNQEARKAAYLQRIVDRQKQRRLESPGPGKGGGRPAAGDTHRKVKVCAVCGNLPERRPPEGCWRCKFPAGPAAPIVPTHRNDND